MSRGSLATLEKRLRKVEARQTADVGKVAVVDLLEWKEADWRAYDAAENWEAQADVVERVQGERPVLHADNGVVLIEIRPAPEPGVGRRRQWPDRVPRPVSPRP